MGGRLRSYCSYGLLAKKLYVWSMIWQTQHHKHPWAISLNNYDWECLYIFTNTGIPNETTYIVDGLWLDLPRSLVAWMACHEGLRLTIEVAQEFGSRWSFLRIVWLWYMNIYKEQYPHPLVNVDITNWKITMLYCSWVNQHFLFSMAIFNSYVCLLEGIQLLKNDYCWFTLQAPPYHKVWYRYPLVMTNIAMENGPFIDG